MCNTDQPTLGLEFQERRDSWWACVVSRFIPAAFSLSNPFEERLVFSVWD